MPNREMICRLPDLPERRVIGDPAKTTLAPDRSGMLVYVQDVETGSKIRVGKQFLFDLEGNLV